MLNPVVRLLTLSLLSGVVVPAIAQDTSGTETSCTRLQQIANQNASRFRDAWMKGAREVVQQGDQDICRQWADDAAQAARQLDAQSQQQQQSWSTNDQPTGADSQIPPDQQQTDATGQIVVQQPQPQVTVQQQAPQVSVNQQQPQVTVSQPQPQIIVRQQQPTVHVKMPQPVITIDQPQPEIIVRMPKPQVAVVTPQPEVKVTQSQPQVKVTQPKPEVQVQMPSPDVNVESQPQANIQIHREQPIVQLKREGDAQVNVQQGEPKVSYEAAKPKLEVEPSGAPKVVFNQTGTPQVRFEQMPAGGQANADQSETGTPDQAAVQQDTQQVNQQQTASNGASGEKEQSAGAGSSADDTTGSVDQPGFSAEDQQRIGSVSDDEQTNQGSPVAVSDLQNKPVVNYKGQRLGTIDSVVQQKSGDTFVVISHGGFLGLGERNVAFPVKRLSMANDGQIRLRGLTPREMKDMPRFDAQGSLTLSPDQTIAMSRQ